MPPQTNEVRRSTCLIAAGRWLAARHGLPIRLSEMGASAGLNLFWDKMCLRLPNGHYGPQASPLVLRPEWTGPPPANVAPEITERCGVDLNPLDFHDPADCLRLRAYLWPDQPQRRHLTDAAIDIARATGADMHKGDAADWLAARLAAPRAATLHLIYTTIAFQYFPAATQARISREIAAAGQASTPDTPIAWLGMEADGQGKGAAISLRIWPGDETLSLGRIDYHGRWIRWAPPEP